MILIDPRRAAAFGVAILCGLLLLQFAHRRKPFLLAWAGGWLLLLPAILIVDHPYQHPALGRAAVGLAQFLGIATAAAFLWSGDLFRQTRYLRPGQWKALVPVAAWFLLAPPFFGVRTVLAPGHFIIAALLAATASMYVAVLLERRMIGAGVVAFVLLGTAIVNLAIAVTFPQSVPAGQFAFQIVVATGVLSILGTLGIHLMVFEDMTYELLATNRRLEAAREELQQAAITDPLTGCHNRRFLEQVMDRELQRHRRFDLPLSLLFIDINRFKAVNDSLGHDAGDRVLRHVAQFLRRHIREADYIFRWGGDEFLVLITCAGAEARRKAGVLKAAFDSTPEHVSLPPGIGLSVGAIEVPRAATDLMPLVREADAQMYRDKHHV